MKFPRAAVSSSVGLLVILFIALVIVASAVAVQHRSTSDATGSGLQSAIKGLFSNMAAILTHRSKQDPTFGGEVGGLNYEGNGDEFENTWKLWSNGKGQTMNAEGSARLWASTGTGLDGSDFTSLANQGSSSSRDETTGKSEAFAPHHPTDGLDAFAGLAPTLPNAVANGTPSGVSHALATPVSAPETVSTLGLLGFAVAALSMMTKKYCKKSAV